MVYQYNGHDLSEVPVDYMLARDLASEFESHYPDRYGVDKYGSVQSPGKFQGEAWWVAIVWGYLQDGFRDAEELEFYDQSIGYLFTDRVLLDAIVLAHNQLFPEQPVEKIDRILLHESESGFVSDISSSIAQREPRKARRTNSWHE